MTSDDKRRHIDPVRDKVGAFQKSPRCVPTVQVPIDAGPCHGTITWFPTGPTGALGTGAGNWSHLRARDGPRSADRGILGRGHGPPLCGRPPLDGKGQDRLADFRGSDRPRGGAGTTGSKVTQATICDLLIGGAGDDELFGVIQHGRQLDPEPDDSTGHNASTTRPRSGTTFQHDILPSPAKFKGGFLWFDTE